MWELGLLSSRMFSRTSSPPVASFCWSKLLPRTYRFLSVLLGSSVRADSKCECSMNPRSSGRIGNFLFFAVMLANSISSGNPYFLLDFLLGIRLATFRDCASLVTPEFKKTVLGSLSMVILESPTLLLGRVRHPRHLWNNMFRVSKTSIISIPNNNHSCSVA